MFVNEFKLKLNVSEIKFEILFLYIQFKSLIPFHLLLGVCQSHTCCQVSSNPTKVSILIIYSTFLSIFCLSYFNLLSFPSFSYLTLKYFLTLLLLILLKSTYLSIFFLLQSTFLSTFFSSYCSLFSSPSCSYFTVLYFPFHLLLLLLSSIFCSIILLPYFTTFSFQSSSFFLFFFPIHLLGYKKIDKKIR